MASQHRSIDLIPCQNQVAGRTLYSAQEPKCCKYRCLGDIDVVLLVFCLHFEMGPPKVIEMLLSFSVCRSENRGLSEYAGNASLLYESEA